MWNPKNTFAIEIRREVGLRFLSEPWTTFKAKSQTEIRAQLQQNIIGPTCNLTYPLPLTKLFQLLVGQVPRASVRTTVSSVVDVDLRSLQILKLYSAKSTGCKTETMIKIKTTIEKHRPSLICVLKQLFLVFYDSLNIVHVLCPLQNDLFHFAVAFCAKKNNDG